MSEQARPFKNVNKIETLETPEITRPRPATKTAAPIRERTYYEESGEEQSALDKLVATGWLNWENLLWIGLIALAVFMHLVDLGPRAMHHDESIHGRFSFDMFKGINVYRYDPTWHGPLLYYMVTLSYFVFGGVTETTARLAPAFYGIGLVAICYFLRPLIGRIGGLAMGVFMLLSPSMLYYGRSLRHDIFATMGELLFFIGFFRFIQEKPGRKSWWLPVAGLGFFIVYSSHEMVFLNTGILISWLAIALIFELVVLPGRVKNRTAAERESPTTITSVPEKPRIRLDETDELDEIEDFEPDAPFNKETSKETNFIAEAPVLSAPNFEAEQQAEVIKPQERTEPVQVGDPVLGSFGRMALLIFALIAVTVIIGSLYLFTPASGQTELPSAFGVTQWLLTIPTGLLLALLTAYGLGSFLSYGYARLEGRSIMVGRLVALGSLVLLGTLGLLSGLRAKAPANAAEIPLVNGTPLKTTDTYVLAMYAVPRLLFNLVLVVIAALFLGLIVGWLWQRRFLVYTAKGRFAATICFFVVMLVSSLVSLRFALDKSQGTLKGGLLLAGPEVDKWMAYVFNGFVLALIVGALAGWLVSLAEVIEDERLAGSAILRGVLRVARQPMAVGGFVLVFGILYILIFSNFFFNLPGLADGFYRGIEYWSEQHGKRRLDQPWFYYPFLTILYEILPLVFGFAALFTFPVLFVRRAVKRGYFRFTVRGLFIGYALWSSFLSTIVYSIAGEKAPWLNMQITLPVSLAAAAFLDYFLRKLPWREFWQWNKGPLFALLFVLTFATICVTLGLFINLPGSDTLRTQQLIEALIVILIGLGLFGFSVWLWWSKQVSGRVARTAIAFVVGLVLLGYTVKSTVALNYQHPDTAVEPLIYVQTAPELPLFIQRLDRLSRDLRDNYKTVPAPAGQTQTDPANSRGLPVLFSNEVAWPLEWYLRDYTDKNYFTPENTDPNKPGVPATADGRGNKYVVIGMQASENSTKIQQQLQGEYTPHTYKFRWWFPEDDSGYGGLGKDVTHTDWSMIFRSFTEQPFAGRLWRYLMYRELWNPLQAVDMVVYVRNDIDPNWGLYEGGTNPATGNPQSQAFGLFDAAQPGSRDGQFRTPRDINVTANGDVLVLDSENARVQRFDKDGKFISKFGGPGRDDGKFALAQYFSGPSGLTVDDEGNIYVTDSWNFRIEKFDKDGKFLLKWGDGKDTGGVAEVNQQFPNFFYGPRQIAFEPTRKELYVADTGNKRILVFDKQGQFKRQFGTKGNGPGQFDEPVGVAISPDGSKVYVSDLRNKRVQVLDSNGQYLSEIKMSWNDQQPLAEPYLKTDKSGNLYVSDFSTGRVLKFDQNGNQTGVYDASKGIILTNPVGLAFDNDGNLLIVDAKRGAVVKVTP